jgi:SAM-dependent methyltransferase
MTAVAAGPAFDRIAARYDELWSETAIGRQQRAAVWRRIDPLFRPGDRVLDLGCGSGVDAVHLMRRGVEVRGIDASEAMVRQARARGADARWLAIEAMGEIEARFDGAISNFGALNCVTDPAPVARSLGSLIRPGGYLAICVLGRFCAWEVAHYLRGGRPAKAFRRLRHGGCESSLGLHVYYHAPRRILEAFSLEFAPVRSYGIGVCVPPSYVSGISERAVSAMAALDRRFEHLPVFRSLGDHRLFIFRRI